MKIQKIRDNTNYSKVDGAYVINTNQKEYASAVKRRQNAQRMMTLEERIQAMQSRLDELESK